MKSRKDKIQGGEASGQAVVIFYSTSYAIKAEKVAKSEGLEVKLVFIPRHLSSDCGICLRFVASDREKLEEALLSGKVEYDRVELL